MITQLEILSETFLVADMKEPNVCGGQITRDMYQNLKGDWSFQISKTGVSLKRLTRLTQMSSWAASPYIPCMLCAGSWCVDITPHPHTQKMV